MVWIEFDGQADPVEATTIRFVEEEFTQVPGNQRGHRFGNLGADTLFQELVKGLVCMGILAGSHGQPCLVEGKSRTIEVSVNAERAWFIGVLGQTFADVIEPANLKQQVELDDGGSLEDCRRAFRASSAGLICCKASSAF